MLLTEDSKSLSFMQNPNAEERFKEEALFLSRYIYDPGAFCREIYGEVPELFQLNAWDLLLDRHFVAIRSGNGTGKTALEGMTIPWFLLTRRLSKIPCTAVSQAQMEATLWSEINIWIRKSPYLQQRLKVQADYVRVTGPDEKSWYAVARTAVNAKGIVTEALQGFHAPYLLYIADEASGIPDKALDALESATSTENSYGLLCSNPTRRTGLFFRAFHSEREQWANVHVTEETSSRMTEDFRSRMERKYRGKNTNGYKIRVLGEFPTAESVGLLALEEFQDPEVQKRGIDLSLLDGTCYLSVDPAGSSAEADTSTVGIRIGDILIDIRGFNHLKEQELFSQIVDIATEFSPEAIIVDSIGIGTATAVLLEEYYNQDDSGNPKVVRVNVGSSAFNRVDNFNLRSELYHISTQRIKDKKMVIASDLPFLETDLTELHYTYTLTHKYKVESKDDFRDRNDGRSTDYGDAYALLFYFDAAEEDEDVICTPESAQVALSTSISLSLNHLPWHAHMGENDDIFQEELMGREMTN